MTLQQIKIGTPVIYYSYFDRKTGEKLYPKETVITSEAWELGHGEIVCKVEGISGGVSIKHLEKINP